MADVKKAKVLWTKPVQDDVCYMSCAMLEPAALGFKGGQYIIVNSGKLLANGKLGKRAYSILSPDSQQQQFELAVKRIPDGIGSGFLHDLKPGDSFEFSGPWGKYHAEETALDQGALCIATDTGITAALGVLRGQAMQFAGGRSKFIWFVSSPDYFVPQDMVKAWFPSVLPVFCPGVEEAARIEFIVEHVRPLMADYLFSKIYLSGDGLVLRKLKEMFLAKAQYTPEQVCVESFFHHESLKTAVSAKV